MSDFEPTIVAFLCDWGSGVGAEAGGTSSLAYPPNLRVVRVTSSGRLDPLFVLRALTAGVDGVLVAGCDPGDGRHETGGLEVRRRVSLAKAVLASVGMEPERVEFVRVGANERDALFGVVRDFAAAIRPLGPNPLARTWCAG
jgi:coenzyme F420-reducing hydrogenase delta subunit